MGCCESPLSFTESSYPGLVKIIIEKNDLRYLKVVTTSKKIKRSTSLELLNNPITIHKSLRLNALAYSLMLGYSKIFVYLHDYGCDVNVMETLLASQGLTAMDIICRYGFSEIFSYYLPIFVENYTQNTEKTLVLTRKSKFLPKNEMIKRYTPAQVAAQYGYIQIMTILSEFLKTHEKIPKELDINYQEEKFGENCQLIACRYGNIVMAKYLFEKCNGNFKILNKKGHSAINIAAICHRSKPHLPYLRIIKYLIESIGIDPSINFWITLKYVENEKYRKMIVERLGTDFNSETNHKEDEENFEEESKTEENESSSVDYLKNYIDDSDSSCSVDDISNKIFGNGISEIYK